LDLGIVPTLVNIAKKCGRTRQAVHQMLGRHPDLHRYIAKKVGEELDDLFPLMLRRHYYLGMQGSVDSAEFIAKVRSGYFESRRGVPFGETDDAGGVPPGTAVVMNFLVPRPDYPQLPPAPIAAPTLETIDAPVVEVR
jgi:hypothetical protein